MERYVVMGVSGCGKSTIGKALAQAIGGAFVDADDLHPPSNIAKMSAGIPLNDQDRAPWLELVGQNLAQEQGPCVAACSALKRIYRDQITKAAQMPVRFIYLHGSPELLLARMQARTDHFMPPGLLVSQLATLEAPDGHENALTVDIDQTPEEILNAIMAADFADAG